MKEFNNLLECQQAAGQLANQHEIRVWIYLYDKTYRISQINPVDYSAKRPQAKCVSMVQARTVKGK